MSSLSQHTANALIKCGRLIVWFYYSPIRIIGKNNLPPSGPLLLVANHANSLIDAVLVGLAAGRRVRFLANAPLFGRLLFGRLLSWVGMIPVHRPVDDPTQVRRSLQSLTKAAEALAAGAAIGIFPEGKSHDSRTLTELPGGIPPDPSNEFVTPARRMVPENLVRDFFLITPRPLRSAGPRPRAGSR